MEKFTPYSKTQLDRMDEAAVISAYGDLAGRYTELRCELKDVQKRLDKSEKEKKKIEAQANHYKEEILVFLSRQYGVKSERTKTGTRLELPPEVAANAAALLSALGLKTNDPMSQGNRENGTPESGTREGSTLSDSQNGGTGASGQNSENGASGKEGGEGKTSGGDAADRDEDKDKDKDRDKNPSDPDGSESKGLKGNRKPVARRPGFMDGYSDLSCSVYEIDGFRYTPEDLQKEFLIDHLDAGSLLYLSNVADITVTNEYIPSIYLKTIHIRPRIRRRNLTAHACINSLLHTSVLSPSLWAHLTVGKFGMGMPWGRISRYLEGRHIHIRRDTMAEWAIEISDKYLKPLTRRMRRLLVKRQVLQGDETYVVVTESEKRDCYFWMIRSSELDTTEPTIILFTFDEDRDEEVIKGLLKGFRGYFISDGYICYKKLDGDEEEIFSCLCWAHARRLYYDVLRAYTGFDKLDQSVKENVPAWKAVNLTNEIFAAEREARQADEQTRLKIRDEKIRPMVDKFFRLIKEMKEDPCIYMPGSLLARAINYSLNGEERFRRFLDNAQVPLDNNGSERCMVKVSIGRNGWKTINSLKGAESVAIYYSLIETAEAAGVNQELYFKYLYDVMPDICEQYKDEIADKDNDLAFLDCMMPWSEEFKAYAAQETSRLRRLETEVTNCLTRYNILENSPIDNKYTARIIRAQKNVLPGLVPLLKELDADSEEHPEYYKGPVRGAVIPKQRRPYVYLKPKPESSGEGSPGSTDSSGRVSGGSIDGSGRIFPGSPGDPHENVQPSADRESSYGRGSDLPDSGGKTCASGISA